MKLEGVEGVLTSGLAGWFGSFVVFEGLGDMMLGVLVCFFRKTGLLLRRDVFELWDELKKSQIVVLCFIEKNIVVAVEDGNITLL